MRVVLIIDNLGSGGAQRQMVNLALGLSSRGHSVTLLRYAAGDHFRSRLDGSRVVVQDVKKGWRFDPLVIERVRRALRAAVPDVALSFLQTPNTYNLLARAWPGCRWKTVVSERSFDAPGRMPPGVCALRQLYRRADAVVFNSHHQRFRFERALPWAAERSSTIYNGVDLDEFQPPPRPARTKHIRLLAVGSVSPYKNGLVLVEALALLRDRHGLDARVQWIGRVERSLSGRHSYYSRMVEAINRSGLQGVWEWLPPQQDLRAFYWAADALVHASTGEGLPNVVCEALACGLPVVASDCLDHPLLVRPGETGFLFDPHDPQTLAEAVKRLAVFSERERLTMARAGRAYAERNLGLRRMVDSYEGLLTGLARPSGGYSAGGMR